MRVIDKIQEINEFLDHLKKITPSSLEEYELNITIKAACERLFEKIIEATVDLVFLIIKEKELRIPEDDKAAFDILYKNNIIPKELCERLKDAKGMRNIIAHQYGIINDEMVYNSITEELENDVKEFIRVINRLIK